MGYEFFQSYRVERKMVVLVTRVGQLVLYIFLGVFNLFSKWRREQVVNLDDVKNFQFCNVCDRYIFLNINYYFYFFYWES